ncbi:MAG: hypothetical protein HY905_16520 [Deltaproteobacteria bacterium]|nr:hypothetical protein [Deltaproteobacteria bacterium]
MRIRIAAILGLLPLVVSPAPPASADESLAAGCRRAQEGDLAAGEYAGRWETQLVASGGELGMRVSVSFDGELRVTVDDAGALTASSGSISFTMTGDAEGLPPIVRAGLNADGTGTLEPGAAGRERFGATGTVSGGANVFAAGPTAHGGTSGGGSDSGTFEFTVAARSCSAAEGTFTSDLLQRMTAGLSAGGLTITVNVPPQWSVQAVDRSREQEAGRFREKAERIPVSPHDAAGRAFDALFTEIDRLPAGQKACVQRVVREVYVRRVEQWLNEDLALLQTFEVTGEQEDLVALVRLAGEIAAHDLTLECSGQAPGNRAARLRPVFDTLVRAMRAAVAKYDMVAARQIASLLPAFAASDGMGAADGTAESSGTDEALQAWADAVAEAAAKALEMLKEVTDPDVNASPEVIQSYEDWARATERERRNTASEDTFEDRVTTYCSTTERC